MNPKSAPAVGIDLGTTFSVVARLDETGAPRVIPNSEGDLSTPSVVYFHDSGVVVGKEAVKVARYEPDAVAQFAKRDMGRAEYHRPVRGQRLPPEVLQALILLRLKQDAAVKLGEFSQAVITVPAYFDEPRRKATMDAGRLAGIDVLDIINEPTAAAFAYGIQEGFLSADGRAHQREEILVYDLGGGTFDVTLMEIDGLRYRALATDGDVYLGGLDWDQRIADHVARQFHAQCGLDVGNDPGARISLLQEAEDAKRALSSRAKVSLHFAHAGERICLPLTAEQLEEMTGDLVDRTILTAGNLLAECGRKWSDLTRVLLVGGSSRMPMVQKALEQASGLALDRSLLTEEPVAMGAAVYAGLLLGDVAGGRPRIEVQNISSHPLGVLGLEKKTGRPRRKVLIRRNTPLPASGVGTFVTFRDGQTGVLVNVIEGGDDSGTNATQIGRCVVSDLPPGLPAGTPVKVKFAYATNGRLTVTAAVPSVQSKVTMTLERPVALSDEAMTRWRQWIQSGAILQAAAPVEPPAEPMGLELEIPEAEPADETADVPPDAAAAASSDEGNNPFAFLDASAPQPEKPAAKPAVESKPQAAKASAPKTKAPAPRPERPQGGSPLDDFLSGLGE